MSEEKKLYKFWLSFIQSTTFAPFELHTPWWISGYTGDGEPTICAAVMAEDEDDAEEKIYEAFDECPDSIQFRFIERRPDDWSPFGERFPQLPWMQWSQKC